MPQTTKTCFIIKNYFHTLKLPLWFPDKRMFELPTLFMISNQRELSFPQNFSLIYRRTHFYTADHLKPFQDFIIEDPT